MKTPERSGRGWPKRALKLGISGILIGFLLWRYPISVEDLAATFRSFNPQVLLLLLPLLFTQYIVSGAKWQVILRSHDIDLPLGYLVRSYLVGAFFGSLLPSSVGGDISRIADVARDTGRGFESTAAVILDRFSGLVVLTAVGIVGSVLVGRLWGEPEFFRQALVLTILLLLALAPFAPGTRSAVRRILRVIPHESTRRLFDRIASTIRHYGSRPNLIWKVVGFSLLFQFIAYTNFYLYGRALNLPIPYLYCLAFVPVVFLLEALPISFGGFGVREGALVYFLGKLGLTAADAISISIVLLSARYLKSLAGGIVYAWRRKT